jgi:hypothetical protein
LKYDTNLFAIFSFAHASVHWTSSSKKEKSNKSYPNTLNQVG